MEDSRGKEDIKAEVIREEGINARRLHMNINISAGTIG